MCIQNPSHFCHTISDPANCRVRDALFPAQSIINKKLSSVENYTPSLNTVMTHYGELLKGR